MTVDIYNMFNDTEGEPLYSLTGTKAHTTPFRQIFTDFITIDCDTSAGTLEGYIRLFDDQKRDNCCISRITHDFDFRVDSSGGVLTRL